MKIQKIVYIEPELNERLRKLGRHQSEFICAVIDEVLRVVSEEEIMAYRARHGNFDGILSVICGTQEERKPEEKREEPVVRKEEGRRQNLSGEVERLW